MKSITPEQIDELLPQTQCGLCGYGGCMPYAEAMVFEQATINLCPPGGVKTLRALGNLLNQDAEVFIADMDSKAKPPLLAVIREEECIGCKKCINACPVDAILGSGKHMHTIISDLCTGCELCIPPCPVDCIDLIATDEISKEKSDLSRQRFQAREKRLHNEKKIKTQKIEAQSKDVKQRYIAEALARARANKKL